MISETKSSFHSVGEEWLASYCAAGLSRAKRLLIACQAAMKPELSARLDTMDNVGGLLLESAPSEAVSDDFFAGVMDRIDAEPESATEQTRDVDEPSPVHRPDWMPLPLADFIERNKINLRWKKRGFGIEQARLLSDDGEELYLLKARPGMKIPEHSHNGEEWALILQGGYHVGPEGYVVGDLHQEDEETTHSPVVDNDEHACITLVAVEGKLKFSHPVMRLLKPVIGI